LTALLDLSSVKGIEYPETSNWINWLAGIENPQNHVVFPVLHGPYGEDGTIQGLLDLLDMPYVGAGVAGSAVAMNKIHTKEILLSHKLPVLPWISLAREEYTPGRPIIESMKYPLFTKPANMGSSVGISRVTDEDSLREGIEEAFRFDDHILVEQGIEAREIEVSVLGGHPPQVSLPGEIVPDDLFYSYQAKYLSGTSRLIIPATLEDAQRDELARLAGETFRCLQLDGMARIDFLMDRRNGNEPNTIPGFTQISMYPKLWEASGIDFPQLLKRLVDLALIRKKNRERLEVNR
jgi:D-alanine-D-alanine ligase